MINTNVRKESAAESRYEVFWKLLPNHQRKIFPFFSRTQFMLQRTYIQTLNEH